MAATGEWELVVKSGKKGKNASIVNGKLTKDERKEFIQKAPKAPTTSWMEAIAPAIGKENRKPKSPKANADSKKKETKKSNASSQQPRSLDEALDRLSVAEMQSLLDVVMSRFIDTPLIWLKDLAAYLNVRISPVKQSDPIYKGYDYSYPASRLTPKVKKLLITTLGQCNDTVLASFHKHCITSMVQEQIKGLSVAGYKLFIQILSIHRPHVGVIHLQSYIELLQSIQNQTPVCLSLLWAVGQAGIDDFAIGLKVWISLMVPLIGLKNYSTFVVEYGSNVFSGGGGGGRENYVDVLGVREFFTILDFTWCSSGSLPKPLQRQLFALYPKVKTTAFTATPEHFLRNFFPSFLRRLNSDISGPLKTELMTCLVQCLIKDHQCWSVWSQLYHKHLPQSAILLRHLDSEADMLSQSFRTNKNEVQSTLKCFAETNKQMGRKLDSVVGLREADEAILRLLGQLRRAKPASKSSGSRLWSFLVTALILGIVWDIKSAGSFYDSKVGWAVERAGLLPYVEAIGRYMWLTTIQAYRWCIYNIPFYYSKGCDLAEPYLLFVWSRLVSAGIYIWTGAQSAVQYGPVIRENIEKNLPGFTSTVSHYSNVALENGMHLAITVKDAAVPYLLQLQNYINTQVLVGALAPEKLYEYLITGVQYITDLLHGFHSTLLGEFEQDNGSIPEKGSL